MRVLSVDIREAGNVYMADVTDEKGKFVAYVQRSSFHNLVDDIRRISLDHYTHAYLGLKRPNTAVGTDRECHNTLSAKKEDH